MPHRLQKQLGHSSLLALQSVATAFHIHSKVDFSWVHNFLKCLHFSFQHVGLLLQTCCSLVASKRFTFLRRPFCKLFHFLVIRNIIYMHIMTHCSALRTVLAMYFAIREPLPISTIPVRSWCCDRQYIARRRWTSKTQSIECYTAVAKPLWSW